MVRKKLDERVRTLLERGVVTGQRSLLVLVGDHGKDQVPNLHQLQSKLSIKSRPKVLWCYKKELGFSTHRKKRIKKLKRDKARGLHKTDTDGMDNFELFVSSTDINWCYYKDTHRVLGTTVGMLVLQDFEALTPNILARTMETVEGGGIICILLKTVSSLKQLYAMTMDVHARYRTESSGHVVPRFNERFLLSLGKNSNCLVCDDELNVLPLSKTALKKLGTLHYEKGDGGQVITHLAPEEEELQKLQESLSDTPHVGVLTDICKTLDQAKALLVFLEACSEKTAKSTVCMTAARGRGKSAAMGLCLAGAISFGYSNICVTAPEPENLVAVFDFLVRGLKALKYQEHLDFALSYNTASGREETKCVVAIHVHKSHRQVIQYIPPHKTDQFASAELVAIDEAAAIPLPTVKALMSQPDRLVFLSSTVHGYEGTGRALSLKLIQELREKKGAGTRDASIAAANAIVGPKSNKGQAKVHEQKWAAAAQAAAFSTTTSGGLKEMELSTPIRYAVNDPIETWLNKLLCLDCGNSTKNKLVGGAPAPSECELYSVDRDALFSYHKLSEAFLQKIMGLYTSAHYKNSPNDLQMLSDAPAHSVFCLLSPSAKQDANALPDVLAVVQVALEGKISRKVVEAQLARGHRSAGDLIPWTVSQQFGDSQFAQLSGARIVRIAVHPSVQGMGYGSRAVELLYRFYNGEMISLTSGDSDEEDESEQEEKETDLESFKSVDDDNDSDNNKKGILGEKLKPRKELPPLLLPLTEVDAPRLDWLGTSFGLTGQLHKFWTRAGMRLLYLRQTTNELTGEHSAIMVRALPKRTGVNDAWLPAFCADTQRRFIALLGGSFQDMNVRLAISVLESLDNASTTSTAENSNPAAMEKRGSVAEKIGVMELNYFLTPHDLKRLELYGRNLCDHHLVTDLLPALARLYFMGRFGSDFKLSSLQAALLCGIGLQNRSVDSLTAELGLPSNQVLAMFNKGVRKMSIALNAILEESEKAKMLGGEDREKAEQAAKKMQSVSRQTLQEDVEEAAKTAMTKLKNEKSLPPKIMHNDIIMQYAVKGSDEQWSNALKDKEVGVALGTVQIHSVQDKKSSKRKLDSEDLEREVGMETPKSGKSKSKKSKKSSSKKSSKKNRS